MRKQKFLLYDNLVLKDVATAFGTAIPVAVTPQSRPNRRELGLSESSLYTEFVRFFVKGKGSWQRFYIVSNRY